MNILLNYSFTKNQAEAFIKGAVCNFMFIFVKNCIMYILYDGADKMSGIKQEQPLALYVHCGAHCTNLIAQKACLASLLIRDALVSQSGKFKTIHAAIAHAENPSCTAVIPLCTTR